MDYPVKILDNVDRVSPMAQVLRRRAPDDQGSTKIFRKGPDNAMHSLPDLKRVSEWQSRSNKTQKHLL